MDSLFLPPCFSSAGPSFINLSKPISNAIPEKDGGAGIDLTNMSEDMLNELAEELDRNLEAADLLEYVSSIVLTSGENDAKFVWNMGDQQNTILQKLIQITSDNI